MSAIGTSDLVFDFDPSGRVLDGLRLFCKGISVLSDPVTFADGKYHHLAVVYDDGLVTFHLDGKADEKALKAARVAEAENGFEVVAREWYARWSSSWSASHAATVIGDTVNTAKRIQENSAKNQILISKDAYERVKKDVEVKPHAEMAAKGKSHPLEVFEVISLKKKESGKG